MRFGSDNGQDFLSTKDPADRNMGLHQRKPIPTIGQQSAENTFRKMKFLITRFFKEPT